jgi:hypothetical protein
LKILDEAINTFLNRHNQYTVATAHIRNESIDNRYNETIIDVMGIDNSSPDKYIVETYGITSSEQIRVTDDSGDCPECTEERKAHWREFDKLGLLKGKKY